MSGTIRVLYLYGINTYWKGFDCPVIVAICDIVETFLFPQGWSYQHFMHNHKESSLPHSHLLNHTILRLLKGVPLVECKCSYVNRPSFRYASFGTGLCWEQTVNRERMQRRNRNLQNAVNDTIGKCIALHGLEHKLLPIIYMTYGLALLNLLQTMVIPTRTITILKSILHMVQWLTGKKCYHRNNAIQITVLPEELINDWWKNMDKKLQMLVKDVNSTNAWMS